MAIIDILLSNPLTPKVVINVRRKVAFEKPNGASGYTWQAVGDFSVAMQALGTLNKLSGMELVGNLKGNEYPDTNVFYSHDYGYKVGDIVTFSGLEYEIKSIETNGYGTSMTYVKCMIEKVDNQ